MRRVDVRSLGAASLQGSSPSETPPGPLPVTPQRHDVPSFPSALGPHALLSTSSSIARPSSPSGFVSREGSGLRRASGARASGDGGDRGETLQHHVQRCVLHSKALGVECPSPMNNEVSGAL